jgi:hypothetical protein
VLVCLLIMHMETGSAESIACSERECGMYILVPTDAGLWPWDVRGRSAVCEVEVDSRKTVGLAQGLEYGYCLIHTAVSSFDVTMGTRGPISALGVFFCFVSWPRIYRWWAATLPHDHTLPRPPPIHIWPAILRILAEEAGEFLGRMRRCVWDLLGAYYGCIHPLWMRHQRTH